MPLRHIYEFAIGICKHNEWTSKHKYTTELSKYLWRTKQMWQINWSPEAWKLLKHQIDIDSKYNVYAYLQCLCVLTNYELRYVQCIVMFCFELNEFQTVSNYVIRCKSHENVCFAFTPLPHFCKQTTWDCVDYYLCSSHFLSKTCLIHCNDIGWLKRNGL